MDMLDDDREDLDGKDAANSGEDAAIYGLATLYYWQLSPYCFFLKKKKKTGQCINALPPIFQIIPNRQSL